MIRYSVLVLSALYFWCITPSEPFVTVKSEYEVVKKMPMQGWAQDVETYDTIAYVTQGQSGLAILSVKDVRNPVLLSEIGTDIGGVDVIRGYAYTVATKQCIVYVGCGSFGLTVINGCDDPYSPVQVRTNSDPKPAKNMVVYKKLLITANSERGFDIASIAQPSTPDSRGSRRTPGYCNDVCISTDSSYLLIACGEGGFAMYPLNVFVDGTFSETGEEMEACTMISHIDLTGYAKSICTRNSIAYIACKKAGLQVIDYSDTLKPQVIATMEAKSSVDYICIKDTMVYMIDGNSFVAVDVSNPSNPLEKSRIRLTYPGGITTYDNSILIADQFDGLVVIQHTGAQ